jgi:hypothetical protein
MTFFLGIMSNILANLVFWLLLGVIFWAVSKVVIRRFLRFFGLVRVDRIGVYLSNLWKPQASLTQRPVGYAISLHELRAAQSVEKLFGSATLRLPDVVRGLVDALWLRQRVQCKTDVSPVMGADADLDRNLIIIGSSMRNSVRARYVQAQLPRIILTGEDQGSASWATMNEAHSFTITRGEEKGEYPAGDVNLAVIEKCHDPERGTTIFFCLGIRGDASWAASEYLVRNWKLLAAEYDDRDFMVCLGFPMSEEYLEDYREPINLTIGGRLMVTRNVELELSHVSELVIRPLDHRG